VTEQPPWTEPEPPEQLARRARPRAYDRRYNRIYIPPPEPPAPRPPPPPVQVPIRWSGLDINPGHVDEMFTAIVELVEGWYASPPLVGNDTERALADGGAWGFKVIGPRQVTIHGAAVGPRAQLMAWRDQLAMRAADRQPAELAITDPWLGVTHTAMVRAGTDQFNHTFIGGNKAFRYQVVVTAGDPLLYGQDWHQVVLTTHSAAESGRLYQRDYVSLLPAEPGWRYGSPDPPRSSGYLVNAGNAPAPVLAYYAGDLSESRLADDGNQRGINLAAVEAGVGIYVPTATLQAQAQGGGLRTQWVLGGSRTMTIPPRSAARWHLYAQGSGSVTLAWRSAWV
jgi:hypothetical protein